MPTEEEMRDLAKDLSRIVALHLLNKDEGDSVVAHHFRQRWIRTIDNLAEGFYRELLAWVNDREIRRPV